MGRLLLLGPHRLQTCSPPPPFPLDLVIEAALQIPGSLPLTNSHSACGTRFHSTKYRTPTLGQGTSVPRMEPHLG